MQTIKELLNLNVIQIDKTNVDYSQLEKKLNSLKDDKFEIIFVADKKDIENENQNLKFIRIGWNQKKNKHALITSKNVVYQECNSKINIINFVKENL